MSKTVEHDYSMLIIFICCLLFIGEPDLYDAIMHYLMK